MTEYPAAPRELTLGMRRMLYAASALVFGVGVPLLVLTEYTDVLFAWTVQPPLTAAFLGACYWSAGILEFTAARERLWARARVAVPGALLFTVLTCIPTVSNVRHFNLRNPAAYAWIAVYFCVPPIMGWLWLQQARTPAPDEPRTAPMPGLMRAGYAALAAALLTFGLLMFAAPTLVAGLWPWELNPPEGSYANLARMEPYIGVWLLGLGTVAAGASRESDLRRIRCVLVSGAALPALVALAVARYPSSIAWARPAIWLFAAGLLLLEALSACGLTLLRREDLAMPPPLPPPTPGETGAGTGAAPAQEPAP